MPQRRQSIRWAIQEPTYVQVAAVIAARIEQGVCTDRLPPERALAEEFSVGLPDVAPCDAVAA